MFFVNKFSQGKKSDFYVKWVRSPFLGLFSKMSKIFNKKSLIYSKAKIAILFLIKNHKNRGQYFYVKNSEKVVILKK